MSLVLAENGESIALKVLTNLTSTPENFVLHLYTSNTTPTKGDTLGTYTEATGFGYAAKTLTGSGWSTSGANPTTISYAAQVWTFTGALGNVYGYYVTRASTGDLVLSERFSGAPWNIVNNGDTITITPQITAQ